MRNVLKSILAICVFLVTVFMSASSALAVDLTVTCDGTDCDMTPTSGAALFEESNWLPGDTVTRTITIDNSESPDACDLVMSVLDDPAPTQTPADFATRLWTVIKNGLDDLYGIRDGVDRATNNKTLDDLYNGDLVNFGVIPAGATQVFDWTVTFDLLAGNEYQNAETEFDFAMYFECGEAEEPELVITKTNDHKFGPPLGQNDIVSYTVTVENIGAGPASNVEVIDTQPVQEYFHYLEDSGRLTCTPGGPTNDPITATVLGTNLYSWPIGDMDPGELCTLTYQLQITSINIPGTHHNLAFARGLNQQEETIFSNTVIDPFEVGISGSLSDEFSGEREGEVLGASTIGQVLGAATGSKTFWLVLAAILVVAGWLLRLLSKRFSNLVAVLMIGAVSLSFAPPVLAVDNDPPAVAIVQMPEYTQSRDFEISYTALDGGEAGLASVHLEFKKDGGSWQDLGTFTEVAKKVSLSGKITEDGKYFFRATACDNNSNCAEDQTSTTVKTSQPPPPEDYHKEQLNPTTYKLTWHNPDVEGLDWVFIYRSDDINFTADGSTKIAQVPAAKDTDGEYTDTVPDAGKTYYYAIREVDKAGNASDLVGDTVTGGGGEAGPSGEQVTTGQTTIPGQEPTAAQFPFTGGAGTGTGTGTGTGAGTGGGAAGETPGAILGEEEPATPSPEPVEEVTEPEEPSQIPWGWLTLLGTLAFLGGYLYFSKKAK